MSNQKLIEDNIKLVYHIIHKCYPSWINDEDVVQAGMLGLCKAADTWDESKSKFSTYAGACISNEIKIEFRNRKKHNGVLSLDYEMTDDRGEDVSLGELCVGEEDVEFVDLVEFNKRLTPKDREIIGLRQQGLTTAEIGKIFGCSSTTISRKLRKMIATFKNLNS